MKVFVNQSLCQGHLRCYATAPDLFEVDEEGFASTVAEDVPPGQEELARAARELCPERAITTSD